MCVYLPSGVDVGDGVVVASAVDVGAGVVVSFLYRIKIKMTVAKIAVSSKYAHSIPFLIIYKAHLTYIICNLYQNLYTRDSFDKYLKEVKLSDNWEQYVNIKVVYVQMLKLT